MFEINKLTGNTSYYSAFSNVGIVEIGGGDVILIDTCDHQRMIRGLDRLLGAKNLRVRTIIDTHCHVDHIAGNKYFSDKYGCEILAPKGEAFFVEYPDLEAKFYYAGIDTEKSRNPFFMVEPTVAEVITDENTPEGLEIIPLPGHSFDMIGVRTQDDVVFLADAVLSKKTWDEHKLPFYHNINAALETLEEIKNMKGRIFVPAHDVPTENVAELAEYNIKRMKERKELVYDICEGVSFDDMFALLIEKLDLHLVTTKYPMYAVMLRNFLQSLVDDKAIYAKVNEEAKLIYHRN
ncbi:MAG: MBL fold metallo-hydrolase [Clostridia bacterium]|nr:MBL fold metallo-hydrolase [Clostridia bacterium]